MEELLNQIRSQFPNVDIDAYESKYHIELMTIKVPTELQNQKIGTHIIQLLQNYAKQQNKPIVLRPQADKGQKANLLRFYKNLGFVQNKGRNIDYTLSSPTAQTMYWKFKEWLNNENQLLEGQISSSDLKNDDYRGLHRAPDRTNGAPLHDVTHIYPDDFYSPKAFQYYGVHHSSDPLGSANDRSVITLVQSLRNKPNAPVTVYRAIPKVLSVAEKIQEIENQKRYILKTGKLPKNIDRSWQGYDHSKYYEKISNELENLKLQPLTPEQKISINNGDWVTISRLYAKQHGDSALRGSYRIISKRVKAKDLYTDGNSIYEWGYDPS